MCLSHSWYYHFGHCVLYDNRLLDGCDDFILCSTKWFKQLPLEFWKWLVYKDFILKDTKLLVKIPWSSREQSTIFTSSISRFVFLISSILSDPLVCVDPLECVNLVLWKELNNCFFLLSSSRVYCSRCWTFCLLLCFFGWIELPAAHHQRFLHSWQQFFQGSGTWKLYTDSPRVGSWNRMHQLSVATLYCYLLV